MEPPGFGNAPGNWGLHLTAISSTEFVVTTTPAVTLSATPTSRIILAGQPATYTININRANFPGLVDLSVSGLPVGATYIFSSDPTTASNSSLRIDTTAATATGTRTLTISGTAPGVTIASITVTLTVNPPPGVTLTANPITRIIKAGQTVTYTININRTSFWNPVSLSLSGLPSGLTYSFNSNPANGQVSTLTIPTAAGAPMGVFTLMINGTATGITIAPINVTFAIAPSMLTKQMGTPGTDGSNGIAVDPSGNVYITGSTFGAFPGENNAGMDDAFLAKYDINGSLVWVDQFGSSNIDSPGGLVLDGAGNIYISGGTFGDIDGPGRGTTAGGVDAWVAKYDSSGNRLWITQFGTSADDSTYSDMAIDTAGNVYVGGYTKGDLDKNGPQTYAGGNDAWMAKLDTDGMLQLIRQLGTSGDEITYGVAVDGARNIYIAGMTDSDLDGAGPETHQGGNDVFIAKYDSSGALLWIRQLGTPGTTDNERANGMAVDNSGNIYITGFTTGDLDGLGPEMDAGSSDAWIAKYNGTGTRLWLKQLGTTELDWALAVVTDSAGNVYITGETYGDLDASGPGIYQGQNDAWVAKYNGSGARQWIKQVGTPARDVPTRVAIDSSGNVYITGYTEGDLDGMGPEMNYGGSDAWFIRYIP